MPRRADARGLRTLTRAVFFGWSARLAIACAAMLAGCGGMPPAATTTIYVPSPNHNERRPNFIIVHDTTNDTIERPLKTLTDPSQEVSAHYLIGRDGSLYQLVDESRRAWHAGQSYWGGLTDLNSASIGIELDNTGDEAYAEAQIVRLIALLKDIQARYRIPSGNVLGHGDIAPRRKVDPGRYFPWERLAKEELGAWCPQDWESNLPEGGPVLLLQAIGYDVTDPIAALKAFRRHHFASDAEGEASAVELRWMHCLIDQKRRARPD
jgi:N-acetylmuramoyl-L-alanine amidase